MCQESHDSLKVPGTSNRLFVDVTRAASICENTQEVTDAFCKIQYVHGYTENVLMNRISEK